MNNQLIQQYGEEILSYRIRNARQKKRMQHEDFEKQLITWHKGEIALWRQRSNLGWVPLIPPFQKGWKRSFVLRPDVARGKHAVFFDSILKKINTHDWSHRKDFLVKRKKFGKKIYVVKHQQLLAPWECHFLKLGFSETEKQFFRMEEHWEKNACKPLKRYVFSEPWRFVLQTRPNMIEKIRIMSPVLEARLAQIDNYLKRNDYRKKQMKILCGYYQYKFGKKIEKYNESNPIKGKSLIVIINLIKDEKI
jgi:hypothetical protein